MDRFLMQYLNNKFALTIRESVKNSPVMGWGGLSKQLKCQKKDPSINQPTKPYTQP